MDKSILELTDAELQSHFWEWVANEVLINNATRFKEEVVKLVSSWNIQSIKPIYKSLNATPIFHQWRVYHAFWDLKWALACFKKVMPTDENYFEAQYEVIKLTLLQADTENNFIDTMMMHLANIPMISKFHGFCCMLIGDVMFKEWKKQEALEWYLKVQEDSPDFSMAKTLVSQTAEQINTVSLQDWSIVFKEWEEFQLGHFFLGSIDHISNHQDYHGTPSNPTAYVLSLSHNENGMQEWKFTFLATPYHSIDDGSYDWTYIEPEELDTLVHPISTRFIWLNNKWELEFEENTDLNQKKKFPISLIEAQVWVRIKWRLEWTWDEQNYLVWEQWNDEVIAITYGENHPQSILKKIREELNIWFLDDVPELIGSLAEWSVERKIADKELSDWIKAQPEQPIIWI